MNSSPSQLTARGAWHRLTGFLYFAFLAGILLSIGIMLVRRPLFGRFDFWAHAAVGRWIWQNGHAPDRTLFLWTASEPWVYQCWLFQVLCYHLTEIGRPDQLPYVVWTFTAVLSLFPFALVCSVWRSSGRLSCWMAAPLLLALQGAGILFHARPELFTVLFLCVLMMFLLAWSRARNPGNAGRLHKREYAGLAGLLFLFVLWINLHGAVVLGLLLLAVTACADLVQDRFDFRSRILALFTAVVPLALCVNPYGVGYWRAFRPVGTVTFAYINEWQPVWKGLPIPLQMIIAVAVVTSLALLAWAMNPKRRLAQLGWLLLLGVLFAFARRNVWPFTFTCLMVLAANARSLDPEFLWGKVSRFIRRPSRAEVEGAAMPSMLRWLVRTAVLSWLVLECLNLVLAVRPWEPLATTRLERGVVRYIRGNELSGRVFNDYENSSYLQWGLAGNPDLYIDLINAYPDQVMRDYLNILNLNARGRALLDEQRIEVVVLTTNRASPQSLAPLADCLDASSLWSRVFVGKDGVIWVRRTPAYEHLWKPVLRTISDVSFKTLERFGDDTEIWSPAIGPEDMGGRKTP